MFLQESFHCMPFAFISHFIVVVISAIHGLLSVLPPSADMTGLYFFASLNLGILPLNALPLKWISELSMLSYPLGPHCHFNEQRLLCFTANIQNCDDLWTTWVQKMPGILYHHSRNPQKVTDKQQDITMQILCPSGQFLDVTCLVSGANLSMVPIFHDTLLGIAAFRGLLSFQSHFPTLLLLLTANTLYYFYMNYQLWCYFWGTQT